MIAKHLHSAIKIIRGSFVRLTYNDPLRLAGATAFFTSFALPPILMIIVRTLGLFLDRRTVGRQLSGQLSMILGQDSTASILQAIRSFRALQHNYLITICLFIFLIFVATTLFNVIRNSINQIWQVRRRPRSGILAGLQSRVFSLAVILLAGILFFAMQLIDTGRHMLGSYLVNAFPETVFYLGACLSEAIVILISAVWFFVLFMLLPDARPATKIALTGAILTSILFNIGKWVLQLLLRPGQVRSFYGASGAIVLVLLFVFYSSMILYFGAAFIRTWSEFREKPLHLKAHALRYRMEEVEEEDL